MNGPSDGGRYIDSIDPDDPEYVRQMRRPAEVKEDIKQMEHRKRVDLIMQSAAFREELEQIVHDQLKAGPHPASLLALQQISELVLPQYRFNQSSVFSKSSGAAIPIADIRGVDSMNYGKGEKILRCKLASCYRLVDLHGWTNGISHHVTARITQEHEHFLVNPHGMLYHEITASSLVKATLQGEIVDPGTTSLGINKATFALHAAIHAARPDVKAIIHLHNPSATSVSAMQCGLLPLSEEAIVCGEVSYYDYCGSLSDQDESDQLTRALGPNNKVLVLRNFGILSCGESVEEAYYLAGNITTACETQLRTIPAGLENIKLPSEEMQKKMHESMNMSAAGDAGEGKRKWRRGEMEFEALMRYLDNAGYRTGYVYHEPVLRSDRRKVDRANSEVEIPPTASSFSDYWDQDGISPLKQQHMFLHKKAFKSEWLNTPNAYKKEEFDETGTPNPKKITKWVPENSPNKTTAAIKVDKPGQFVPQGDDPKELASKHKMIRKDYYDDRVSAGPQSRILEGISWEEAQRMKDGQASGNTEGVIVVGAASKGIIQRDHQHNANVYKTYYAPNPFDNMSAEEIDKYKNDVERKARGESTGDTTGDEELVPGPDGRLISTEERMHQVRMQQDEHHNNRQRQYLETSLDDLTETRVVTVHTRDPPSPTSPGEFQRSASARYTAQKSQELVQELNQNFNRSKSERKPKGKRGTAETEINGAGSPTKSTSSGEVGVGPSSQEGSPTKELPDMHESPSKGDKKKKKFRMPSFSKTKKDKK